MTLPLGLAFVDGSVGFNWEKATVDPDKTKAAVRAMILWDMVHL
jgi:hypothetical protein